MFLKTIKTIKSKTGELHFTRFALFSFPYLTLCFHVIRKEDQDPYLHNHPWNLISLVLWGKYIEETETGVNTRGVLNLAIRDRGSFHKIQKLLTCKIITLNILWGKRGDWGYKVGDKVISNEEWRLMKQK